MIRSQDIKQPVRKAACLKAFTLFMVFFALIVPALSAQDTISTTLNEAPVHSPHRATIYSAVLPGLGQAYNRKYWKIPIIYGGFATLGYFIFMNTTEYHKFREAYNIVISGDTTSSSNDYVYKYGASSLLQGREYYRRNMEFTYILAGALYILNIVDAAVDAHLWDFDVGEDLSLHVQPVLYPPARESAISGGLSVRLNFR